MVLQLLAALCCFTVPGSWLLRRLPGAGWRELPLYRRAGYSLVVSLALLAALQSLAFVLPVSVVRGLIWAFFLACLGGALHRLATLRKAPMRFRHALALVVVLAAFTLGVLWVNSLADIPGSVAAGYGDLPSYHRVIDNLSRGQFPLIDFRSIELPGERYFPAVHYPLPMLVSAFFETLQIPPPAPQGALSGTHRHLLVTVSALIGAWGLFFCGGYLYERHRQQKKGTAEATVLALGLVPLLWPGNAFHFVMGAVTLPLLTYSLVLMDLVWESEGRSRAARAALAAVCCALMVLTRPEGLLLVVLLACLCALYFLLRLFTGSSGRKKAAAAALGAGLLLAVPLAPYSRIMATPPAFTYLHYQEATGSFRFGSKPYVKWYHALYDNVHESVGRPRLHTRSNPQLFHQVAAHPAAYGKWLTATFVRRLGRVSTAVFAVSLILLLRSRSGPSLVIAALGLTYFAVLTSIVPAFSPRHSLPVATLVFVMAARSLGPAAGKWLFGSYRGRYPSPALALAVPLLVLGLVEGYRVREVESRSPYVSILAELRQRVEPSSLVASDYPQLLSYSLDVEAVGNSILFETLEPFVARYSPDFVVIDDTRPDTANSYRDARDLVERGGAAELGYEMVVDDPQQRFLVLAKDRGAGDPVNGGRTPETPRG